MLQAAGIIFFPSLSLPYEKSLYESTSFFISVCFRELKSFLTLNRGKKIIKKDNFWGDRNFFEAVLLKYNRVLWAKKNKVRNVLTFATTKDEHKRLLSNRTIPYYLNFRTKTNINSQIKSINLAKTIAIYPLLWYNYRGRIRILYKLSFRRLEGCLPLGQTLGLRTFTAAKVRARARSNRGRVVNIVAILHHKVVASLRLD